MGIFKTTERDKDVALGKAIMKGSLSGMESALKAGAHSLRLQYKTKNGSYSNAYVWELIGESRAADAVKLDMYRLLIRHGLKVDDVGNGQSLLHKTVSRSDMYGCEGMVEMLIGEYNVDVCAADANGYVAFDAALSSWGGSKEKAIFLLGLGGIGPYSAYVAINKGRASFLKAIMEVAECAEKEDGIEALGALMKFQGQEHAGLPVQKVPNVKNIHEWALLAALDQNDIQSFDYLMSNFADRINFSFSTTDGYYLHFAGISSPEGQKMALALIEAGAPLETKAKDGRTVLEKYCHEGPEHKIEAVVAALIEKAGARGLLPEIGLDQAARAAVSYESNFAVLGLLLDAGAGVNALNGKGETLLMAAAERCDIETVEFLLARGADKGALTPDGMSAYDLVIVAMQEAQRKSRDENTRRKIVVYNRIKDILARDNGAPRHPVAGKVAAQDAGDSLYTMPNKQVLQIEQGGGLTMTFNFWTQEVVYRDNAGGLRIRNFDEIQRQSAIAEAFEILKGMGGEPADPTVISMPGKKLGRGNNGGLP